MMKSIKLLFSFVVLFLATSFSFAQSKTDWKEKTEFHKVMSQTFHPAEEGNYTPIKTRIDEFQMKAIAFKNSTIPADFGNKKSICKSLKTLVKQSKKLNKKIKSGASDADLKEDFIELHDTFHTIVGLCKAEDETH